MHWYGEHDTIDAAPHVPKPSHVRAKVKIAPLQLLDAHSVPVG